MLDLIWRFRDPLGRFHLHTVSEHDPAQFLPSLGTLEFAGALILDQDAQQEAAGSMRRPTLEAQEAGAVDTVTVTPAGLLGDYGFGRAFRAILQHAGWDGRDARATIVGEGPEARAAARELSSMGVSELTVISGSVPAAEQSVPPLAMTTRVLPLTGADPFSTRALAEADLILRLDATLSVPFTVLGPHLTLVDLGPEPLSRLRSQALNVGALSFNRRDWQAHFLALALTQVLGTPLEAGPFLDLFHSS